MKKKIINIKKALFPTIFIFMIFITSGCSNLRKSYLEEYYDTLPDSYNAETDYPSSFYAGSLGPFVTPSSDGYYAFVGRYLYFIDKKTKQASIVCNRPECRHMNETDQEKIPECQAYFQVLPNSFLQYYEGHLYVIVQYWDENYVSQFALVQCSLDGANRKYLCKVDSASEGASFALHRGYLYEFSSDADKCFVERWRLDNLESEAERINETAWDGGEMLPMFYGNTLYITEVAKESDDQYMSQIHTYDLRTKEDVLFFNESEIPVNKIVTFQTQFKGEILYSEFDAGKYTPLTEIRYYLFDPVTREKNFLAGFQNDLGTEDDSRRTTTYLRASGDVIYCLHRDEKQESPVYNLSFLDENLQETKSSISLLNMGEFCDLCPGDEDFAFIGGMNGAWKDMYLYMVDKSSDTPDVTCLVEILEGKALPSLDTLPVVEGL